MSYRHSPSPMRWLPPILCKIIGGDGVAIPTSFVRPLVSAHVFDKPLQMVVFAGLVLSFGSNLKQFQFRQMSTIASQPFGDISYRTFRQHTRTFAKKRIFGRYDYGSKLNQLRYGSNEPPSYALDTISNPTICLFYGRNDYAASGGDVQLLKSLLNVPLMVDYEIPDKKWCHLDFQLAKDLGHMVNEKVVNILNKFDKDCDNLKLKCDHGRGF